MPAVVPPPIREIAVALSKAGERCWLTGDAVRCGVLGEPPRAPFEMLTTATPARIAEWLPRAVPVRPGGAVFAVPTAAGALDVVSCRRPDPPRGDLAHRAFRVHAIALDPIAGGIVDPFDGAADARRGRLATPGRAADRLAEHPPRALRAAALVAIHGWHCDPDLEAALSGAAEGLGDREALDARRAWLAILDAPQPRPGLALLARSGLGAALAPGLDPRAAERVAAVPVEEADRRALRLAIWLAGTPAARFLRRFRFGEPLSARVLRLLAAHPIEAPVGQTGEPAAARLARRFSRGERAALVAWRRAELDEPDADPAARARLDRLESALSRLEAEDARAAHRRALALDGRAVMAVLGCGPGPHVGRALRALAEYVEADPARNTAETLTARLRAWAEGSGDPSRGRRGGRGAA